MTIGTRAMSASGSLRERERRTIRGARRRLAPAIAAVALPATLLSGCGSMLVVKPGGAEHVITTIVQQKTGITPTNVHCPSGVAAKVNQTFTCSMEAQGTKYTAHMKITSIKGTTVGYYMTTSVG